MFTCSICRFDVELDDVVIRGTQTFSICLRCFARETGSTKPMPRALRRQLSTMLAAA